MFFTIGIPLFTLEAILGQIFRKGPVEVLGMVRKKFAGVGWAALVVCWIISLYYAIILCWAVYYFFLSFVSPLPWSPEVSKGKNETMSTFMNLDFFKDDVLKVSGGIEDMGKIDTGMMGCLVITYILIYMCISKGIQSSSKVVYVTAPAPIFLLVVLMFK